MRSVAVEHQLGAGKVAGLTWTGQVAKVKPNPSESGNDLGNVTDLNNFVAQVESV